MNSNNNNNNINVERIRARTQAFANTWSQHIHSQIPAPSTIQLNNNNNYMNNHKVLQLEQKTQEMHKQILKLNQQNKQFQQQNKQLTLENNNLKLVVKSLAQFCKNGPSPQHHLIPKMKSQDCPWTVQINKIKQIINKYHNNKHDTNSLPTIDIQDSDYQKDNGWITDNALRARIKIHIQQNGEYNSNQKILLKKRKSERKYIGEIKDELRIRDCDTKSVSEVIQTFKIPIGHRVNALENQLCLKAKTFIPKGTVLGRYIGKEYLEDEYETVYEQSVEYHLRNMYAFETIIYIPNNENDNDNDIKMNGNGNGNSDEYYDNAKKVKMIIDGWDKRKDNKLIYINDCRKDIQNKEVTDDDEKYWNCSFKTVTYNGYPAVFVIARQDIHIGNELNIYYGDGYGISVKQKDKYELFMARVRGLIDNSILKILGMEGGIPDRYILDM